MTSWQPDRPEDPVGHALGHSSRASPSGWWDTYVDWWTRRRDERNLRALHGPRVHPLTGCAPVVILIVVSWLVNVVALLAPAGGRGEQVLQTISTCILAGAAGAGALNAGRVPQAYRSGWYDGRSALLATAPATPEVAAWSDAEVERDLRNLGLIGPESGTTDDGGAHE